VSGRAHGRGGGLYSRLKQMENIEVDIERQILQSLDLSVITNVIF
jgi:hypothetical protein